MFKEHPKAILLSICLHLAIIGLAIVEFSERQAKPVVSKQGVVDQTIKAEVIDQKQLDNREREIKKKIDANKKAKQKKQRLEDKEKKRKAELKKKKQQEKKRKQEEARKKQLAEKKRKQEAERKKNAAQKKKKAKEEKLKKAAAEKKRKEAAIRKAEAEKKRKLEEARKKAEEEKRLQEEARKKAEQEARLKAETEQRRKEAELKAQIAAEERQRELDSKRNKYHRMIRDRITRNWRQPLNAGNMPLCEVKVNQGPGGIILDVTFGDCPGTKEYRLSVEMAVLKSDPLPKPEDPSLFDKDLVINFKPK